MSDTSLSIVVLDGATLDPGDNPWDDISCQGDFALYPSTPPELVLERAAKADVVMTNKTLLPAAVLEKLPRCRYIGTLSTGYDVVDIAAAGRRGIPVSNVPGYGTESVAQFVMAQLLALTRRVELHDQLIRTGRWHECGEFTFWDTPQIELSGKTFGVVGFGAIGRRTAELALAFGMRVVAHAPRPKDPIPGPGFSFAKLEELFACADIVSLHCPLTDANAGFVNQRLLSLMPRGGYLINTARGKLVNEADLAQALVSGHLAGAALDVLGVEPPVADNPLLKAPNCLITPHMAWGSLAARKRLTRIAAQNLRAFLAGQPQNVVNADYLTETA